MAGMRCLAIAAVLLSGCADEMLSDARLRDATAFALYQPAASVTITDRTYDGLTNTRYVAHTPGGSFNCTINGGGALALGMTNPAECSPIGVPVARRRRFPR